MQPSVSSLKIDWSKTTDKNENGIKTLVGLFDKKSSVDMNHLKKSDNYKNHSF